MTTLGSFPFYKGTFGSHSPEDRLSQPARDYGGQPPDQLEAGEEGEAEEPEPEEDVDLLVHDVEGEDAEPVHHLYGARGTVLLKCALSHLEFYNFHKVKP